MDTLKDDDEKMTIRDIAATLNCLPKADAEA